MIELLVGQIASGKSTYCKKYNGALIVNDDAIVNSLHGGRNFLYDENLKPLYKQIENDIIHYGISHGLTVIIDRPNVKRSTRIRYISLAHALDEMVKLVIFPRLDPHIHAKRRFEADARGWSLEAWKGVANRLHSQYEQPDKQLEKYDLIEVIS